MDNVLDQSAFSLQTFPFPLPRIDGTRQVDRSENQAIEHHFTSWPVLYILTNSSDGSAYIGETTNYKRRMLEHEKNPEKDFDTTLFIDNPTFNQSTTFDYENRLIELFVADEKYRVTNKNNGHYAFDYYQRPQYRQQFRSLWEQLRARGYAKHSIGEIENTDLYKYSPFKGLTPDQYEAVEHLIALFHEQKSSCVFVNGMPGTGKSILAITLLFKLRTDAHFKNLRVALVSPMEQLRKTYQQIAKSVEGLRVNDVIGPSEVAKGEPYDVLLVDEAHRMYDQKGAMGVPAYRRTCEKLGLTWNATQWDWIIKASRHAVFFFDPKQQVRATGLGVAQRDALLDKLENESRCVHMFELSTQMRVRGGDEYLDFIYDILTGGPAAPEIAKVFPTLFSALPHSIETKANLIGHAPAYELAIVDSFEDFCKLQLEKERECGLSRMAAGYAWEWISKNNPRAYDIEIDGIKKRWNSTQGNWVNSPNAIHEVGSIHTVQGYDLNYAFIIIGNDITYNKQSDRLEAVKAGFKDRGAKKTATIETLQAIVINAYYVLLTRGMRGTYIYICDSEVKRYFQRFIPTIRLNASGSFEVCSTPERHPWSDGHDDTR